MTTEGRPYAAGRPVKKRKKRSKKALRPGRQGTGRLQAEPTKLGIQEATQFVVLLERGRGDSVKEIADYWGQTSIDEIYAQVMAWKTRQQCSQPEHVGLPAA